MTTSGVSPCLPPHLSEGLSLFSNMYARLACSQSSEASPGSNAHLAVGVVWLQPHATLQTYMDSRNQFEFWSLHLHGMCYTPLILMLSETTSQRSNNQHGPYWLYCNGNIPSCFLCPLSIYLMYPRVKDKRLWKAHHFQHARGTIVIHYDPMYHNW